MVQGRRAATEEDVTLGAAIAMVGIGIWLLMMSFGAAHRHREVMDELCRMSYPECVIGVDRSR